MSGIKVGDMVRLARPRLCCGHVGARTFGKVFTVASIFKMRGRCTYCGADWEGTVCGAEGWTSGHRIERLKRIPPLELESTKHTEELTA